MACCPRAEGVYIRQATSAHGIANHYIYIYIYIVETLQVGFSKSTVTVEDDAGTVTLTVDINQNALVTVPITVTYSTSDVIGKTNAASKSVLQLITVIGYKSSYM